MAAPRANELAKALTSAAAAVADVTKALETGLSRPVVDELKRQSARVVGCVRYGSESSSAVPSNVRQAALALSHALPAANKALTAKLRAAEHAAAQRPTAGSGSELNDVALSLQDLGRSLMEQFTGVRTGDRRLSLRDPDLSLAVVAAAGACLTDACSLANSVWHSSEASEKVHIPALTLVVHLLDHLSAVGERHTPALAALRASALRPEAILTALRRLLPGHDPPGPAHSGENDSLSEALYNILSRSIFEDERAAIARDREWQADIVATMDESIQRFLRLAASGAMDRDAYFSACSGIGVLADKTLAVAVRARVAGDPARFMGTLAAAFDLLLEQPPPDEDLAMVSVRPLAVISWSRVMVNVFGTDGSGPLPPLTDSVGCIRRAAAAVAFMIQQPDGGHLLDAVLYGLTVLMGTIPALNKGRLRQAALSGAEGSPAAARRELFVSLLAAMESVTRVAALQLAHPQLRDRFADGMGSQVLSVIYRGTTGFLLECVPLCCPPRGQPSPDVAASQVALKAAAGMLESLRKLALVTAGQGAGLPRSWATRPPQFKQQVFDPLAAACCRIIHTISPAVAADEEASRDPDTRRCWQGVALAAASTVGALAGLGRPCVPGDCQIELLVIMLVPWPGVSDLLLDVPFGRSAVHQALLRTMEFGGEGESRAVQDGHAAAVLGEYVAGRARKDALMFARCGTLTELASWGERQCGRSPSRACLVLLRMVVALTDLAVTSSGAAGRTAQAAYAVIGSRAADLGSAAYWRRLRGEVVEPLAAALEAEAAAEKDPAQVAVDVAEALATRTCAHVGCTTVAGASEAAAPRGKRCASCHLVRYCGAACQKADWRAHKPACLALRRRSA